MKKAMLRWIMVTGVYEGKDSGCTGDGGAPSNTYDEGERALKNLAQIFILPQIRRGCEID